MSSLMIRCPLTGLDVWTGVDTDPKSLEKIPDTYYFAACPHCRCEHLWSGDEAWLTDDASADASANSAKPLAA